MRSLAKFFWIGFLASAFALAGCAGSKSTVEKDSGTTTTNQDEYGEIEQLLGISPQEQQKAAPEQNQDDLLSLLTTENQSGAQAQTQKPAVPVTTQTGLEQQIDDLNKKIQEKDKTIALLRSQVMAMEESKTAPASSSVIISGQSDISDEEYEINYQHGYNLALNKQYKEAIQVFETLLAANTRHNLSDNAQYWIGECYFALGDYRAAILAFEKVFTFKQSNKNDYAQFKLGLCYYQLNDKKRAREEFQSLVDNYQNPGLTSKAEEYLAKL